MRTVTNRCARTGMLVAALGVCGAAAPLALAQNAGTTIPATAAPSVSRVVDDAARSMREGQYIRARALLMDLMRGEGLKHASKLEQSRALDLLGSVQRLISQTSPYELSVLKGEYAMEIGDLRLAEQHARAVLAAGDATAEQAGRARALLHDVESHRDSLTPMVSGLLDQAEAALLSGRFEQARVSLQAVQRSGVELSANDTARLEQYIGAAAAGLDDHSALAVDPGVFQPGTVERRQDEPPTDEAQPAEDEQPVEEAQPSDEAQPADESEQPMTDEQLVEMALRFEAQSKLAQADRAYEQARYQEAYDLYVRLSSEFASYLTKEQVEHAKSRASDASVQLMGQPGAGVNLGDVIANRELIRQEARATFETEMGMAERSLRSGDIARARERVASAELQIRQRRDYFGEAELENLLNQARRMLDRVNESEDRQYREAQRQRQDQLAREAADNERRLQRDKLAKINEYIDQARAYQAEMRYEEALQAIDQVLFLDPINPAGLLLRDVLQDTLIFVRSYELRSAGFVEYATLSNQNKEAIFPGRDIVNYPADWPRLSIMRGEPVRYAESPENRRVLAELDSRRLPATFNDTRLADVIDFASNLTQLEFNVDWQSLDEIGIDEDTPVQLNIRETTGTKLLNLVMDKVSPDEFSKADWAVLDGIVTVASDRQLRKVRELVIYDISDLLLDIPDYTEVPEIDLNSVLQSGQGGGGQSPFRDDQGDQNEDRRTLEERTQEIIDIIQANVDFDGWQDNGGETGFLQQLNGALIITNTAKNHREIAGLLTKLREVRAMQINVETRFLLVNQDWFEQIGFDIDVYFNANNNQVRAAQGLQPQANGRSFFNFAEGNGYNQGIFTTVPADNDQNGNVGDSFIDGGQASFGAAPRSWSPIGVESDSLGLVGNIAPASDWASAIIGGAPALGIAGQFLDDIQVDFLIEATQADRRSVQLTAPRLTFTNGQIANIYVATQVAFISDLQPIVGESAVGFDPEIDVVTEGVTMLVEGTISADRRYVTMNVDAGVSRIDGFGQEPVTAVAGGQLVNSADTQSFIQTPTVTVTRVRTTVTVPDQGTILLGGQRLVTEFEVESGVPVLSKMPILNRFFSNRIESKEEQTLLVLIKPTVLIQGENEERSFPGLAEQLRSGLAG